MPLGRFRLSSVRIARIGLPNGPRLVAKRRRLWRRSSGSANELRSHCWRGIAQEIALYRQIDERLGAVQGRSAARCMA
jgi:hypothetical protein